MCQEHRADSRLADGATPRISFLPPIPAIRPFPLSRNSASLEFGRRTASPCLSFMSVRSQPDNEEDFMQSMHERLHRRVKGFHGAAIRRDGLRVTSNVAAKGMTGFGILVLLFLASLAYVAFGGKFALEASPLPGAATSMAEVPVTTADASGALGKEKVSFRSAQPAGYFPADYPGRGRDGAGNIMSYEHD
jgi:hypothetical protein